MGDTWVYISVDSTVGVRSFEALANLTFPATAPSPGNTLAVWDDVSTDTALPAAITTLLNAGPIIQAANTDIRPEDALFATNRALAALNTTDYSGLGYSSGITGIGNPIDLFFVTSTSQSALPVTVFLYSWPSGTDRFLDDAWCRTVTQRGAAAVGFVSALTGGRYHDRPWRQWFVSELPESLAKSVHDVQMILNYLETRHDLDSSRVGMFGQGSGGTIALLTASVEPRLKAMDVLDPWGDWPDWYAISPIVPAVQRDELNTSEFLRPLLTLDPLHVLATLAPGRLRLLEVTLNPTIPTAAKIKFREAAHNQEFVECATELDYREHAMKNGAILLWLTSRLTLPR